MKIWTSIGYIKKNYFDLISCNSMGYIATTPFFCFYKFSDDIFSFNAEIDAHSNYRLIWFNGKYCLFVFFFSYLANRQTLNTPNNIVE